MYGGLQGLNKSETVAMHGDKQVLVWRRSYDTPPPVLEQSSQYWPGNDRRYAKLAPGELPATECLKDTVARFLPFWESDIGQRFDEASACSSPRTATACARWSST